MVDVPPASSPYICDAATLSCHWSVEQTIAQAMPSIAAAPVLNNQPPSQSPPPVIPSPAPSPPAQPQFPISGVVELRAEQQEFNTKEQIVSATGNVVMRFRNALLKADQLEVNLISKTAVATGKVTLQRGSQLLRGDRFEYYFSADKGVISQASGEVYQPSLTQDLNLPRAAQRSGEFADPPLSETLQTNQPVRQLNSRSSTGVAIGGNRDIEFQPPLEPQGTLTRFRYRADRLEFDGKILSGKGIRLTNDPFSPPELEIRADSATFQSVSPEENQVTAGNARITVDQSFNLPLVVGAFAINKFGQDNNPFGVGIDGDERGGLYLETNIKPLTTKQVRWTVSPQFYLQRAIAKDQLFNLNAFGIKTRLDANLTPSTTFQASAALTSLEPSVLGSTLRARLALRQDVNLLSGQHVVTVESAYRDRIFNGTLGFQDIQSSLGITVNSPKINLGGTGFTLTYLAGIQLFNANTDRPDLIGTDGRVNLGRLQVGAGLTKSFRLWEGVSPPVNERSTYNYSPIPVVPYLQLNTGIDARVNSYSNGDNQSLYGFNVSLQGQVGNFIAPAFDYTGFNIGYSQGFLSGSSPFLFDRFLDTRVITAGINQQLYGPFKLGVQASINVDTGRSVSTDYYLEYSRRTFSILVRYNPILQLGTVGFKLNDLDWRGQADPF